MIFAIFGHWDHVSSCESLNSQNPGLVQDQFWNLGMIKHKIEHHFQQKSRTFSTASSRLSFLITFRTDGFRFLQDIAQHSIPQCFQLAGGGPRAAEGAGFPPQAGRAGAARCPCTSPAAPINCYCSSNPVEITINVFLKLYQYSSYSSFTAQQSEFKDDDLS